MNRVRLSTVVPAVATLFALLATPFGMYADIYRWDNGELITHENAEPDADLIGVDLSYTDLSGADLTGASMWESTLTNVDLSGANLSDAEMGLSTWTDADLSGAILTGADLWRATVGGFTKEQLYSTASYQNKNLQGIELWGNDLSGWDFSEQSLIGAFFIRDHDMGWPDFMPDGQSNLTGADLSGADLRNAILSGLLIRTDLTGANLKNANLYEGFFLPSAVYDSTTIYNQWTLFHDGAWFEAFDPVAEGLTFAPSPVGDLDANDVLDAIDVDQLSERIRGISPWKILPTDAAFDLNSDGGIDQDDHRVWVQDLKHTWFGDANLDGEFNSSDLVQVFVTGKYEKEAIVVDPYDWGIWEIIANPVSWSEGDWNGDSVFDSGDMGKSFVDGGYEQGARPEAVAVPEPGGWLLLMAGSLLCLVARRSRCPV